MNNLNHQSLSLPRNSWEHLTLPHLPLGFVLESRSPLRNPGYPSPSRLHRGPIGWLDTVDSVGSQTCLVVIGTSVPKKMDAKMCHVTMWCHGMSLLSKPGTSGAGWCPWDSLCTDSLRVQFSLNQPSKERNTNCPTKTQEHTFWRGETLCQTAVAESQAWRRSLMHDSYIIIHLTLQSVMNIKQTWTMNIKLWLKFLGIHWCISQILSITCTKLPALQSTATASKCFKQALE